MQTHNKKIDQLFNEKANAYKADEGFMMQDWNAIRNNLPVSPSSLPGTPAAQSWLFSKIILSVLITTVVAIFIIRATNSTQKNKNATAQNSLSTQNAVAPIIDTSTKLTTPIDTTKPKKRVLYKLKVKFSPPAQPFTYKDPNYVDVDIQNGITQNITNPKAAELQLKSFLSELNSPSQFFTVNTNKDTTITCKEGTQLYIKAHSFTKLNKELVNGTVQLEVREAYSFTDIIGNNLHTISNGNLLESGGMIYLNANQDNNALDINIHNPIQLEMPASDKKDGMQLFYLDKNANDNSLNSDANWVANGQIQEKEVSESVSIEPTKEKTSSRNRKWITWRSIGDQNSYLISKVSRKGLFRKKDTSSLSSYDTAVYSNNILLKQFENNYNFLLRNFGWINCDRFSNNSSKTNITITLPTNDNYITITGSLIFSKIKSSICLVMDSNRLTQNNLPLGEEAYFVCFKIDNNKVWSIIQKITISNSIIKAEDFIELTPAQVKAKLDALGGVR